MEIFNRKIILISKNLFLILPFFSFGFAGNDFYIGIRTEDLARVYGAAGILISIIIPCWIFLASITSVIDAGNGSSRLRKAVIVVAIVIHVASIFECIAYMNTLILGDRTDMTVDTSSTSVYNESNIMVPADYRSVSDTSVNETEIGGKQNNQNPNAGDTLEKSSPLNLNAPIAFLFLSFLIFINTLAGIHTNISEVSGPKDETESRNEAAEVETEE